MFVERLNELFVLLEATSTGLAKFAGCDRSLISRMKNGSRIPRSTSDSIDKLVNGLVLFADDKGQLDRLAAAVSCPAANAAPETIRKQIVHYLYEGQEESDARIRKRTGTRKKHSPRTGDPGYAFGTKIDAVIGIADISNVRLSKMLHIDASTISRFRKGLRIPKADQQLSNDLCRTLFERIWQLGRIGELLTLAGLPAELSSDQEECYDQFFHWLCSFQPEAESSFIENLLDNISSFSANRRLPELGDAAFEPVPEEQKSVYFGLEGIRAAVIRFLGTVASQHAKELWLYSDQNMDWMTQDPSFWMKWTMLMQACVKGGTKIRIIHNINRNLDEMANAINSWLPLYMSGMIESYYCKKQGDNKFTTTIFLCPGVACVSSVHVSGCEDVGIYRYDTETAVLSAHEMNYKKLLSMSKRLVKIYFGTEEEYKIASDSKDMTIMQCSLSLATMPEALLHAMILRSGLTGAVRDAVLSEWRTKNRIFREALERGYVHECVCPAEDELLFSDQVPVNLVSADLTYTPQEYRVHIENIIALSESRPNYRFYALPDSQFANMNVVISDSMVLASRLLPPQASFVFTHPQMCEAFTEYAQRLKLHYQQEKHITRRLLERYF